MNNDIPRQDGGFEIVINGVSRLVADLELSAIASAGFHKEHYPKDTVQIRTRADGTLRTVLGHGRLEQGLKAISYLTLTLGAPQEQESRESSATQLDFSASPLGEISVPLPAWP